MIPPGSRYESAERLFVQAHTYNEYGYPYLEGEAPNLKIKTVNREATYTAGPNRFAVRSAVLDYFVKDGEGIQFLGYKFLGDAKRWHEIADANPQIWYPLDMPMATFIGVPVQT